MSSVFILNGLNFDATDDGNFHIRRLYDIYLSMKNGYFLSFMSNDLLYEFGYPTLGFYPYLLMIPFGLLCFILPINICFYLYILFNIFLIAASAYFFSCEITNDIDKKMIFTLSYLILLPNLYFLFQLLAMGMVTAYALIPFITTGFFRILNNKKHGVLILTTDMTLLIYSHIISTLTTSIILLILCIYNYKKILKNKNIILKYFISAIFTIVLSSMVIFPIIEQLSYMNILNRCPHVPYAEIVPKPFNFIIFFIICIIFIIAIKKYKNKNIWLLFSIILLLTTSLNIFPWFLFPKLLNLIQYGHRFYIFLSLPICYITTNCDKEKINKKAINVKMYTWVVCLFLIVDSSIQGFIFNSEEMKNREFNIETFIGAGDYLPEKILYRFRREYIRKNIRKKPFF